MIYCHYRLSTGCRFNCREICSDARYDISLEERREQLKIYNDKITKERDVY